MEINLQNDMIIFKVSSLLMGDVQVKKKNKELEMFSKVNLASINLSGKKLELVPFVHKM